ncbi:MAG: transglycosylase domain-containing protein, partial [Actinomycetes bacterium]
MVEHRRRRPRWRRLRKILLWTVAVAVALPCLAFGIGYLTFTMPPPIDAVGKQITMVQYADGTPLVPLIPRDGNRTNVSIEVVPEHVRHAVLAAEDRTFYSNPGFDAIGILRAAWNQLRGGRGGGSTITQQNVKNALLGDEQTLWRKYKELVLAVKISQE